MDTFLNHKRKVDDSGENNDEKYKEKNCYRAHPISTNKIII